MKWNIAAVLGLLLASSVQIAPADACGVKLTIKPSTPKKAIAHSSNPSHVLLLGSHSRRLEHDLVAAGHDVEVESSAATAKRTGYGVVLVSSAQADEARKAFGDSVVVIDSGDETADLHTVETTVARRPTRSDDSRAVVAARVGRQPVAAGPTPERREMIATRKPEVRPEPAPVAKSVPEMVAVAPTPAPEESKPARTPPPTNAVALARGDSEVHFVLGGASLSSVAQGQLKRTAKWLTTNSVSVTLEGYADPTGSHDANMALSEQRATAAKEFLVSAGVDASRIDTAGFGDTKLKYGSTDGRNRRVSVVPKP